LTFPSQAKYVLVGTEVTWGTEVATTRDVGLIISDISHPLNREVKESKGISSIATQKITSGIFDPGVSFEGDFQHGRMLEYIFGTVIHATTGADTKHTFTISDNPPSASLEVGNDLTVDTVLTHAGGLIESAEVSISLNENLKLSVDFKGKTEASTSSAGTPVLSTLQVFPHALCSVEVNDVAATEIQSASIAINKIVERSGGVSSNLYQQGHGTDIGFEFTLSLGFTDVTFQELFMGGTAPAATADPTVYNILLQADNGVALGSGRREFSLKLENCIGTSFNEVTSVGGLTFIDWTGVGTLNECFSIDNIPSGTW